SVPHAIVLPGGGPVFPGRDLRCMLSPASVRGDGDMAVKLRRLSYPLGAEVCDIDLARPMSETQFGEIYRAFLDHGILLFRDQNLTREQHIAFSRRFGELDRHDALPSDRHPEYPELLRVTNRPNPDGSPSESRYTGRQWHSDMSFT